jgi:hypothetical protein
MDAFTELYNEILEDIKCLDSFTTDGVLVCNFRDNITLEKSVTSYVSHGIPQTATAIYVGLPKAVDLTIHGYHNLTSEQKATMITHLVLGYYETN